MLKQTILMTQVKSSFKGFDPNVFSFLHLNIRSMQKNFYNFKVFLKILSFNFSTICLSETWCESQEKSQNLNYILSGYNLFYQYRQYCRGRGACLFVKESFCCKTTMLVIIFWNYNKNKRKLDI